MSFNYNANTKSYDYIPKDLAEDRLQVEVGDVQDALIFHPQVNLKRWDDEVYSSLELIHTNIPGKVSYFDDGEKITWVKKQGQNEWKAVFYDKPSASADGGFEFEVHLPAIPPQNYIQFSVNNKNLTWHYQPALTQEQIDAGFTMPENSIGSYAVYHATKRDHVLGQKNYGTGKAFHVYRPYVVDANGNETWGELDFDKVNGILTISVDQTWLNNAVYPVIVDPTFGFTTVGPIGATCKNLFITGGGTTDATGGSVSKLTAYVSTETNAKNFNGAIYNSSLSRLTNGITDEASKATGAAAWLDLPFATQPSVSASTFYYIGVHCANTGGLGQVFVDNHDDYGYGETTSTYSTTPNPINDFSIYFKVSIYATYGAAAPPTTNIGYKSLLGVGL